MAKRSNTAKPADVEIDEVIGNGGELHQQTSDPAHSPTTNQGLPIADDQNSLKAGDCGPTLLEDFHLREKITHFDHERIPERVVHARGYGAHGYFQAYEGNDELTKAAFLCDSKVKTPVLCRFSSVAGSEVVAPKIGGITDSDDVQREADQFLAGAPSAIFDAVCLAPSAAGVEELIKTAAAADWLRMAFAHLKVVGYVEEAAPLFEAAHIDMNADDGLIGVKNGKVVEFVEAAKRHRIWEREPKVR